MDTAFNEKCADEAITKTSLLLAAKDAAALLRVVEVSFFQMDNPTALKLIGIYRMRLEAAIKAEEGAK